MRRKSFTSFEAGLWASGLIVQYGTQALANRKEEFMGQRLGWW